MVRPTQAGARGFSYMLLLWWIAIAGVMLAAAGTVWTTESRRERDTELAFRGQQIARAIQAYYEAAPEGARLPPKALTELLEDRRGSPARHHLRQLWPDPVTGSAEWGLVRKGPFILGVYSTAPGRPLRGPPGTRRYRDWTFMAEFGAGSASAPSAASGAASAASSTFGSSPFGATPFASVAAAASDAGEGPDASQAAATPPSSFDTAASSPFAMPSFELR